MDEHDEDEAQQPHAAEPDEPYPADPVTERVRIVGAEPAAVLVGEPDGALSPAPADVGHREERYLGFAPEGAAGVPPPPSAGTPPAGGPEVLDEELSATPELPHWTDPPTGQVPAVLARHGDQGEDLGSADSGPVWREHEHEWEDSGFEPAMLADEETRVGALEETPVEERRPWEFDDLTPGAPGDETSLEADAGIEPAAVGLHEPAAEAHSGGPGFAHPGGSDDAVGSTPAGAPRSATWWEEGASDRAAPHRELGARPEPIATEQIPAAGRTTAHQRGAASPPRRRAPAPPATPPDRNVPLSVATGVGIAAVALASLAAGTVAALVLSTVVVTLAAAECFAALRRAGLRPATLLGLVATVAVMVSAYTKGTAALPLVLVLVVVTSMVWYLVGAERGAPVEGISATVLGFAWVGLLGSFAGLLLAPSIYPHRHGAAFLLGAIVATAGADVGALAVGSWLGRHQLAPHVSPNKTWEGLIGGAVVAVVASAVITGQVHPWTPAKAAILGAVAAVVGPVGDFCESLVKRDLGLKDMGSLLPGHGGVLDRVDALLFVLPATYYLVRVLHLG